MLEEYDSLSALISNKREEIHIKHMEAYNDFHRTQALLLLANKDYKQKQTSLEADAVGREIILANLQAQIDSAEKKLFLQHKCVTH